MDHQFGGAEEMIAREIPTASGAFLGLAAECGDHLPPVWAGYFCWIREESKTTQCTEREENNINTIHASCLKILFVR